MTGDGRKGTRTRGVCRRLTWVGAAWLLFAACDTDAPRYQQRSTMLRLIPEVSQVGREGGRVFVLTELTAPKEETQSGVVAVFRVAEGKAELLPGAPLCGAPVGSRVELDGAGAGGTTFDVTGAAPADFSTPFSAFLQDNARGVYETGLVLNVGAGTKDALVVAAVYEYDGKSEACPSAVRGLIGMATLRVTRTAEGVVSSAGSSNEGGVPGDVGGQGGGAGDPGGAGGSSGSAGTSAQGGTGAVPSTGGASPDVGSGGAGAQAGATVANAGAGG